MPELNGYKTLDLVMKELGIGEPKVRAAIAALKIEPTTFMNDRRKKYYSADDVERIRQWLLTHQERFALILAEFLR
jgi:hypothetical protein